MAVLAIHPAEHLAEELKEHGMTAVELACRLAVPTNRITGILNGRRAVSGDTALCLAHFFGTSAELWLNLQSLYELRLVPQKKGNVAEGAFQVKAGRAFFRVRAGARLLLTRRDHTNLTAASLQFRSDSHGTLSCQRKRMVPDTAGRAKKSLVESQSSMGEGKGDF